MKVLPAVFDDSLSYYELLAKVVNSLNEVINKDNEMGDVLSTTVENVDDLQTLLNEVKNGKYADLYIEQLSKWIDDNLINYVARMAFYVFPTLKQDNEGRWRYCIYVPQSWKQLKFRWTWDSTRHAWFLTINY